MLATRTTETDAGAAPGRPPVGELVPPGGDVDHGIADDVRLRARVLLALVDARRDRRARNSPRGRRTRRRGLCTTSTSVAGRSDDDTEALFTRTGGDVDRGAEMMGFLCVFCAVFGVAT